MPRRSPSTLTLPTQQQKQRSSCLSPRLEGSSTSAVVTQPRPSLEMCCSLAWRGSNCPHSSRSLCSHRTISFLQGSLRPVALMSPSNPAALPSPFHADLGFSISSLLSPPCATPRCSASLFSCAHHFWVIRGYKPQTQPPSQPLAAAAAALCPQGASRAQAAKHLR